MKILEEGETVYCKDVNRYYIYQGNANLRLPTLRTLDRDAYLLNKKLQQIKRIEDRESNLKKLQEEKGHE